MAHRACRDLRRRRGDPRCRIRDHLSERGRRSARAVTARRRSRPQVLAGSVTAAVDFDDPVASQQAVDAFRVNRRSDMSGSSIVPDECSAPTTASARSARFDLGRAAPAGPTATIGSPSPSRARASASARSSMRSSARPCRAGSRAMSSSALLAVMAALVIFTLGMAQAALRRANDELSERAEALGQANELLAEQMEERAKAEDQLRQSQKMQALGAADRRHRPRLQQSPDRHPGLGRHPQPRRPRRRAPQALRPGHRPGRRERRRPHLATARLRAAPAAEARADRPLRAGRRNDRAPRPHDGRADPGSIPASAAAAR